jgi:hypothetical protein
MIGQEVNEVKAQKLLARGSNFGIKEEALKYIGHYIRHFGFLPMSLYTGSFIYHTI